MLSGKTDWTAGGHSLANRLEAWTMYVQFPYNASLGGFYEEIGMCTGNGTVNGGDVPNQGGYYSGDWKEVNATTEWILDRGAEQVAAGDAATPFFAYQGMDIVHPAYFTNKYVCRRLLFRSCCGSVRTSPCVHCPLTRSFPQPRHLYSYWFDKVNQSAVTVPEWKPLDAMHPCDYQASMLKGCLPTDGADTAFAYSKDRRRRVRSICSCPHPLPSRTSLAISSDHVRRVTNLCVGGVPTCVGIRLRNDIGV
jgi:hypothetical protein